MPAVDSAGLRLWYEDDGPRDAPVIVLSHSFLCSTQMWRGVAPSLAARFRVLNIDFRGHGRSGEITEAFTLYDGVADVLAVLDHAGVERAIWCGLSIGGMVALRAALTHPERVSHLVLLDTDAGAETPVRKLRYGAMGLGARLLGMRPFLAPVVRLMFGRSTRRAAPALVAEWRREFASVHVPSMLRCLDALMARDSLLDRLGTIRAPTLVIVGAEDRSLPPAKSRRIQERIPGSQVQVIPRAGHLSVLEQPGPVLEAMLGFLE